MLLKLLQSLQSLKSPSRPVASDAQSQQTDSQIHRRRIGVSMIIRFFSHNYRNLKISHGLDFYNLNLFVGANNSGKSNFISAMTFLIDLFYLGFEKTIRKRHYKAMIDRYQRVEDTNSVQFHWIFNTEEGFADLDYSLTIDIPDKKYIENTSIVSEKLSYSKPKTGQKNPFNWISCHEIETGKCSFPIKKKGRTSSLIVAAGARESILNQIDQLLKKQQFTRDVYPIFYPTVESVKSYLNHWKYYSISEISTAKLKMYADLRGEESFINNTGDNFANVVRVIFPKYPGYKIRFIKVIQEFIPDLETLEYEIVGDKEVNIFVMLKGERFEWHELSEGTVRLIFLLFILTSPERPRVLFIDEPELNLHPAWQKKLTGFFLEASQEMQLILSTHSPELLDGFSNSFRQNTAQFFIFNDLGEIRRLESNEVLEEQFSIGWELGDLYRVGDPLIGGWP